MPYVALKWDHRVGQPFIQWLVLHCDRVAQKFGGPQAMPPRRDVAYFLDEHTAERDAKAFADWKNAATTDAADVLQAPAHSDRHAAFVWDHNLFGQLIRWAVLEWDGPDAAQAERRDVAYFLDTDTAETDARRFRMLRDDLCAARRPT